mmetsp:Transcript_10861/g.22982  ORF Transcript_10861/g.22982 Transcript_10861/m.22982 type:complete len:83 (-) Transcript_10861:1257-1505(-)
MRTFIIFIENNTDTTTKRCSGAKLSSRPFFYWVNCKLLQRRMRLDARRQNDYAAYSRVSNEAKPLFYFCHVAMMVSPPVSLH